MRTKARHYYPPIKKCRGSTLTIQEPISLVSDTEFRGGGDGRGCGDCIFWSNRPNPAT